MKRIMIIGCGGAGKSTLSRELGRMLDKEVIHLDSLYWQPGWQETPKDEWEKIVVNLVQKEEWIIDGNYSSTMEPRLHRADTVIFLDFPWVLCLWRVVKRWVIHFGRTRPDMREGCQERLDWGFIKWIWTFPKKRRLNLLNRVNQCSPGKQVIILRNPKEVSQFLQTLSRR